jgi:hypothetical protein
VPSSAPILLGGNWNINGLPTAIVQGGLGLSFTNEADSTSSGRFISSNQVVATNSSPAPLT